jgi:transcriptional regulator with XRE-family HTH domain
MINLTKKIGQNIRRIRMEKNITQHKLSLDAQISLSLLNWIEVGKRNNVTILTLEKLANALKVSLLKFLE